MNDKTKRLNGIFLSHTHSDKPFVNKLSKDLTSLGVKVWVDEAEIAIGDSLIDKISMAIYEMEYLGVILSDKSVKSEWVKREVNIALHEEIKGNKVKVLPIIINDCEIPQFLIDKKYVDFRNNGLYYNSLSLLASALLKEPIISDDEEVIEYTKLEEAYLRGDLKGAYEETIKIKELDDLIPIIYFLRSEGYPIIGDFRGEEDEYAIEKIAEYHGISERLNWDLIIHYNNKQDDFYKFVFPLIKTCKSKWLRKLLEEKFSQDEERINETNSIQRDARERFILQTSLKDEIFHVLETEFTSFSIKGLVCINDDVFILISDFNKLKVNIKTNQVTKISDNGQYMSIAQSDDLLFALVQIDFELKIEVSSLRNNKPIKYYELPLDFDMMNQNITVAKSSFQLYQICIDGREKIWLYEIDSSNESIKEIAVLSKTKTDETKNIKAYDKYLVASYDEKIAFNNLQMKKLFEWKLDSDYSGYTKYDFDSKGNIYFAGYNKIGIYSQRGLKLTEFGELRDEPGSFSGISNQIALDKYGHIYIANTDGLFVKFKGGL